VKPTVDEILSCLLHVPRGNTFSINLSLHDAEKLLDGTVQLCFSPSKAEACDKQDYPLSELRNHA
jgi:hypothetical protein